MATEAAASSSSTAEKPEDEDPKQLFPPRRNFLVTGANKGIGKEVARQIGQMPDHVVILGCRNHERGLAAERELQAEGCNCVYSYLDLKDWDSICATRDYIQTNWGRLDSLVNNAAISYEDTTLYGKVEHVPFEQRVRDFEAALPWLAPNVPSILFSCPEVVLAGDAGWGARCRRD